MNCTVWRRTVIVRHCTVRWYVAASLHAIINRNSVITTEDPTCKSCGLPVFAAFPLKKACRLLSSEPANPRHISCNTIPGQQTDILTFLYAMVSVVFHGCCRKVRCPYCCAPTHSCNNHASGTFSSCVQNFVPPVMLGGNFSPAIRLPAHG